MSVWAAEDVDVLLTQPEPMLQPPSSLRPAVLADFDWRPSVLVTGRDLPRRDRVMIEHRGVVEHVGLLQPGLVRMNEACWDVIVVSPGIVDDTDGLRFVRAFKCSKALTGASEQLLGLRERYAATPFVVQPVGGDTQFAVFRSASQWYLGHTDAIPLGHLVAMLVRPLW